MVVAGAAPRGTLLPVKSAWGGIPVAWPSCPVLGPEPAARHPPQIQAWAPSCAASSTCLAQSESSRGSARAPRVPDAPSPQALGSGS